MSPRSKHPQNQLAYRLRKVLMMVRVVNAFRAITGRLSALSVISRRSSKVSTQQQHQMDDDTSISALHHQPADLIALASAQAIGESMGIAAAAVLASASAELDAEYEASVVGGKGAHSSGNLLPLSRMSQPILSPVLRIFANKNT